MKTALKVTGRVELARAEITQAIFDFLKTKGYKGSKIVYLPSDDKFQGAVVEVIGCTSFDEVPEFGKVIKTRNQPSGRLRRNIGIYDTMRELLNEAFKERKSGEPKAHVDFKELLENVKYFHPEMSKEKLYVYLYDKRQLPNISWSPKDGYVVVRGEVKH